MLQRMMGGYLGHPAMIPFQALSSLVTWGQLFWLGGGGGGTWFSQWSTSDSETLKLFELLTLTLKILYTMYLTFIFLFCILYIGHSSSTHVYSGYTMGSISGVACFPN